MNTNRSVVGLAALFTLGIILLFPNAAMAHCDGMATGHFAEPGSRPEHHEK